VSVVLTSPFRHIASSLGRSMGLASWLTAGFSERSSPYFFEKVLWFPVYYYLIFSGYI
jgi:hypothetical protein